MIAPQELRLGNKILRNGIVVTVDNQTFWDIEKYPDQYEPIELTEDWLLKFGFEKTTPDGWLCLNISNDWTFLYWNKGLLELSVNRHSVVLKNVIHVHQLQNLTFALNGEELTIKEQK